MFNGIPQASSVLPYGSMKVVADLILLRSKNSRLSAFIRINDVGALAFVDNDDNDVLRVELILETIELIDTRKVDAIDVYTKDQVDIKLSMVDINVDTSIVYLKGLIDDKLSYVYTKDLVYNKILSDLNLRITNDAVSLIASELSSKVDTDSVYNKSLIYSRSEVDSALSLKANLDNTYDRSSIDLRIDIINSDIFNVRSSVYEKSQTLTKSLILTLLSGKSNTIDVFSKDLTYDAQTIDQFLDDKINSVDVYTKIDINNIIDNLDYYSRAQTYTKNLVNDLLDNKSDLLSVYSKVLIDSLLINKANVLLTYTKLQMDDLLDAKTDLTEVYTKLLSDLVYTSILLALVLINNSLSNKLDSLDFAKWNNVTPTTLFDNVKFNLLSGDTVAMNLLDGKTQIPTQVLFLGLVLLTNHSSSRVRIIPLGEPELDGTEYPLSDALPDPNWPNGYRPVTKPFSLHKDSITLVTMKSDKTLYKIDIATVRNLIKGLQTINLSDLYNLQIYPTNLTARVSSLLDLRRYINLAADPIHINRLIIEALNISIPYVENRTGIKNTYYGYMSGSSGVATDSNTIFGNTVGTGLIAGSGNNVIIGNNSLNGILASGNISIGNDITSNGQLLVNSISIGNSASPYSDSVSIGNSLTKRVILRGILMASSLPNHILFILLDTVKRLPYTDFMYTKLQIDLFLSLLPIIDSYSKSQMDYILSELPIIDSYSKSQTDIKLSTKSDKSLVYTIQLIDLQISEKADKLNVYSKDTIDSLLLEKVGIESVYDKVLSDQKYRSKDLLIDFRLILSGLGDIGTIRYPSSSGINITPVSGNDAKFNTFYGSRSGLNVTTGYSNTFIGRGVGLGMLHSHHNTILGKQNSSGDFGNYNIAIGTDINIVGVSDSITIGCGVTGVNGTIIIGGRDNNLGTYISGIYQNDTSSLDVDSVVTIDADNKLGKTSISGCITDLTFTKTLLSLMYYTKITSDDKYATKLRLSDIEVSIPLTYYTKSTIDLKLTNLALLLILDNYVSVSDYNQKVTELNQGITDLISSNLTNGSSITDIRSDILSVTLRLDSVLSDLNYIIIDNYYDKVYIDSNFSTSGETLELLNAKANTLDVYTKLLLYTKIESDNKFANKSSTYSISQIDSKFPTSSVVTTALNLKADSSDVYSKVESDSKFVNALSIYTRQESDTRYPLITDTNTKSLISLALGLKSNLSLVWTRQQSDLRFAQLNGVYSISQSDTLLSTKANLSDVYTKIDSDSRYAASLDTYTKAISDATFARSSEVYSKLDSDSLYALINEVYTISQIDTALNAKMDLSLAYTKTLVNNLISTRANASDVYTKSVSDGKYALLSATYTRAVSDGKYALLSSTYTSAISDSKYALLSSTYTRTESDTRYPLIDSVYTKALADTLISSKADTESVHTKDQITTILSGYDALKPKAMIPLSDNRGGGISIDLHCPPLVNTVPRLFTSQAYVGNVSYGQDSMFNISSGHSNLAMGLRSMFSVTSGILNTAIGNLALYSVTNGNNNVALGCRSLLKTSGSCNTAIGFESMKTLAGRSHNTAIGYHSLRSATTATNNTAIGSLALSSILGGSHNVAIGYQSMKSSTNGQYNISIGLLSMSNSITGAGYNIAIGYQALMNVATNDNVAIGYRSMLNHVTGTGNVGIGLGTLQTQDSSINNTAIGWNSLRNLIGIKTTAVGKYAGYNITSGNNNIIIGSDTAQLLTTGSDCIIIGTLAKCVPAGNNQIILGSSLTTLGLNSLSIGNESTTTSRVFGSYTKNATTGSKFVLQNSSHVLLTATVQVAANELRESIMSNYILPPITPTNLSNDIFICTVKPANRMTRSVSINPSVVDCSNVSIGDNALKLLTYGACNTAIGASSMKSVNVGVNNIAIGSNAGSFGNYNNCIYIGSFSSKLNSTPDGVICIGNYVSAVDRNSITIGNSNEDTQEWSINKVRIRGIYSSTYTKTGGIAVMVKSDGLLYAQSSSLRYKLDVSSVPTADINRYLALSLKKYKYKGTLLFNYGFIAELLNDSFPNLCIYDGKGVPLSVDYNSMHALAHGAIKRLNTNNKNLRDKVLKLLNTLTLQSNLINTLIDKINSLLKVLK